MTKNNAVAYIRVSTNSQIDNNSLVAQEKAIKAYAKENHLTIDKIYREKGKSGMNNQRPEYIKMMEHLELNNVGYVLIHKIDRLHRNASNFSQDIEFFKAKDITLVSVDEGLSSEKSHFLTQMIVLAARAAGFSLNLSEEARKGLQENAETCRHNGGKPPYGYIVNKVTGLLEINPIESPAVKKMFEMYADSFSMNDIQKWLTENGYKSSEGNDFSVTAIHTILHNEKYRGCYTWDKSASKRADGSRNSNEQKEVYTKVEGGCPSIVSSELFFKVKERLSQNADKAAKRNPSRYYPLTGTLRCECGSPICGGVTYSKGKKTFKYHCNNKCGAKPLNAVHLEELVFGAVETCVLSEPNHKSLIKHLNEIASENKKSSDKEYRYLKKELSKTQKQQQTIQEVIGKSRKVSALRSEMIKLGNMEKQLESRISKLDRSSHTFTEKDIEAMQGRFQKYLQEKRTSNTYAFLSNIIEGISVDSDKAEVKLKHGIAIDKAAKNIMKGRNNMMNNKKESSIYSGILLGIMGYDDKNGYLVRIALSTDSAWSYSTNIEIYLSEELFFDIAAKADKDLYSIVGEKVKVTAVIENDTLLDIEDIVIS